MRAALLLLLLLSACDDNGYQRPPPPEPIEVTVSVEKAGDGAGIARTEPAGLICDVDCDSASFVYEDVAEVVFVAEPGRNANFRRLTCNDQVAEELDDNDEARLTLTTIADGEANDFSCTLDLVRVTTLQVIQNQGTGTGRVKGALSAVVGEDEPKRMDCPSTQTCTSAYFATETETLTATPDVGSVFGGWEFCSNTTTPELTLVMDADQNCRPRFDLE